ncbi:MAG: sulfatase-like hydrolase/transferase [Rhodospirillaceae bacterium]|nr:sulfatase-like hydrolase/transferase [Rhodospirillaceae bacterium]
MKPKNLVIFHLESVAWQTLNAFPEAFPNLNRLLSTARVFRSHFSAATSTQMVVAYLLHANDFELDPAIGLPLGPAAQSRVAQNNPSLFATLQDAGYSAAFLCVTALQAKTMLPLLAASLPPRWHTSDYAELFGKFEALTAAAPFAIYFWNLVTHVEHATALAQYSDRIDELVGGACAVADDVLGTLLRTLERKNLLDDTTIVVFGDHGDDYWTHGFKKGLLHGAEPYSHVVHTPLLIRDASLAAGYSHRLASTIDLAPTCLDLLGIPAALPFAHSGQSLLGGATRDVAFSQNFAGRQPDNPDSDIRKSFSVNDRTYSLLASSRGLELFNHRLDPTNHWNLLHFFDLDGDGQLVLRTPPGFCHPHFATGLRHMLGEEKAIGRDFVRLRTALEAHLRDKRAFIAERASTQDDVLDPACFRTLNRHDRDRFFAVANESAATSLEKPVQRRRARSLLSDIGSRLWHRAGHGRRG